MGSNGCFIKTTNAGATWSFKQFKKLLRDYPDYHSCIYALNENVIFVLSAHDNSFAEDYYIMKSTDGGNSWDSTFIVNDYRVSLSQISFVNETTGYCFFGGNYELPISHIYKTTNAGTTWNKYTINGTNDSLRSVYFINQNTGFISRSGYSRQYYKTTNGGSIWNTYISPVAFSGITFINDNTGWLVHPNDVYRTTNGGINFFQTGSSSFLSCPGYGFFNADNGWAIFDNELYTTSNSGANWVLADNSYRPAKIYSAKFINQNTGFAVGEYGRIIKTVNGGYNWSAYDITKITSEIVSDLCMIDEHTGWAINGGNGIEGYRKGKIIKTINGGDSWERVDTSVSYITINFLDAMTGVGSGEGFIRYTKNSGNSWQEIRNDSITFYNVSLASSNVWYVACENNISHDEYLYKTTNSGQEWKRFFLSNIGIDEIQFLNENTGYLVTFFALFKTTNGGANWQNINSPNAKRIFFLNELTGWKYGEGDIYKTTNGGANWQQQLHLANGSMQQVLFVNPDIGWAVTDNFSYGTALKTTNGGANWFETINFNAHPTFSVDFINENTGWVSGEGGVILKTTSGGIIGVQNITVEIPDKFYLSQNYPNPFNPNTNIEFSLPQKTFVKLKVFDLLGREVANLVNENLSAGKFTYDFNASALPSGIYFYKIETEKFSETRKMVLIK